MSYPAEPEVAREMTGWVVDTIFTLGGGVKIYDSVITDSVSEKVVELIIEEVGLSKVLV
jgi:hypothetical protein